MRRRTLINNKEQPKARLIQHVNTLAGDIVFYNSSSESMLYYRFGDGGEDIIPDTCTPIGVVLIEYEYSNYEGKPCLVMSLEDIKCNGQSEMVWGGISDFITENVNSNDGRVLTNSIIQYRGAKSDEWFPVYNNLYDYPAASICNLFSTPGTKPGDWFLPSYDDSMGLYMLTMFEDVLIEFDKYYNINPMIFGSYWTSTDMSNNECSGWLYDGLNNGIVSLNKENFHKVRAFTLIGALETNYGDIYISGGNVTDVPASGGSSQVTGYTYSQTYGYGDSTTNGGVITSDAEINITSVNGDNLGTNETERTKLGESVLTVTMNGKTAIKSYDVYQEANKVTSNYFWNTIESGNLPTSFCIQTDWMAAGGGIFTMKYYLEQYFTSGEKHDLDVTEETHIEVIDVGYGIYCTVIEGNKIRVNGRGTEEGPDRYQSFYGTYKEYSHTRPSGQEPNDWWDGRLQAFWWSDWTTYRSVNYNSGEHSIIICCYRHYRSGAEGGGIDVTPSSACSVSTSDASTSISKWEGYYYFHYGRYNSSASRTIYIYASYGNLQSPAITLYQTGINDLSYGGLEITELYWYNDSVTVNKKKNTVVGFTCRRWVNQSFGGGYYEYSNPTSVTLSTNTSNVELTQPTYNDNPGTGYYRWSYSYKYTVTGTYSLTINIVCWGQTYSATKTVTVS